MAHSTRKCGRAVRVLAAKKAIKRLSRRSGKSAENVAQIVLKIIAVVVGDIVAKESSRKWFTSRPTFDFYEHCAKIPNDYFKRLYRVTKEQFFALVDLIAPRVQRKQRVDGDRYPAVCPEVILAITLRTLAGGSYLDICWPYNIARVTYYYCLHEGLEALYDGLQEIKFPSTEDECKKAAQTFFNERNGRNPIKGVISALDGLAVKIAQPRDVPDPRKYYNRKSFFAVVVQAACTADFTFTYVSASNSGSTHDSTAIQSCGLWRVLTEKILPRWAIVVCDDAYAHVGNLLCPYSGAEVTDIQDSFNYYQSSNRIVIEQAFGMLIGRWGVFWKAMRYDLATTTLIIMVCCKLHNFIIRTGDEQDRDYKYRLPTHELNNVTGVEEVHLQNNLHFPDEEPFVERCGSNDQFRSAIAQHIRNLGLRRPGR